MLTANIERTMGFAGVQRLAEGLVSPKNTRMTPHTAQEANLGSFCI